MRTILLSLVLAASTATAQKKAIERTHDGAKLVGTARIEITVTSRR